MARCWLVFIAVGACKGHVRQQPLATPNLLAGPVVLANNTENRIEKRLRDNPKLKKKIDRVSVTRGGNFPIVDAIRWGLSLPYKLLLWDRTFGSGELGKDAEVATRLALVDGGSPETHLSINEYNPRLIWSRTFSNDKSWFLTKITLGTLTALLYTLLPGRLLPLVGDHYNAFADTIVIYSDNIDVALHEAGHAIDFSEKQRLYLGPAIYSSARNFFPVTLYQEAVATGKALKFTREHGTTEDLQSSYAILIPAFGTYLAAAIFSANALINRIKWANGRESTQFSKWLDKRSQELAGWSGMSLELSAFLVQLSVSVSVVIGAHVTARVAGAFVDGRYERPINPRLKQAG